MATDYTYTDIDLDFLPHPVTGDVTLKHDDDAVKRSLRNIILTQKYERLFHPEINSRVAGLLFDLASPITMAQIRSNILDIISVYEPRVQIIDVTVKGLLDQNAVGVRIAFRLRNSPKASVLQFTLDRSR